MLPRWLTALLTVAIGLVVSTGVSSAAPAQEYGGACAIGVAEVSPHPGDSFTVTGDNFPASPSAVPIFIDNPTQQIGTAHIDGKGTFSDPATIPTDLGPGSHTISVSCASTGVDSTVSINVLGETVTQSSRAKPLPRTGSDPEPLVLVGLG